MKSKFLPVAKTLFKQSIASLPISSTESKAPPSGVMWRSYNSENYDTEVINKLFQKPHKSFAVMGGHISGGLEILDIDLKNSRDPDNLWRDLLTNIEEALPDFAKNATIVQTVSGGYHIYYSCFQIEGSKVLANEVNVNNGRERSVDVIETRGDGGYALTYPSPGYKLVQGSLDKFAYVLMPEERDILHSICRMFHEEKTEKKKKSQIVFSFLVA